MVPVWVRKTGAVLAFAAGITASLWVGSDAAGHLERLRPPEGSILSRLMEEGPTGTLLPDGTELPPAGHMAGALLRYGNSLAGAALAKGALPVVDLSQLPAVILSMGREITVEQVAIDGDDHLLAGSAPTEEAVLDFASALEESGSFPRLKLESCEPSGTVWRFTLSYGTQ